MNQNKKSEIIHREITSLCIKTELKIGKVIEVIPYGYANKIATIIVVDFWRKPTQEPIDWKLDLMDVYGLLIGPHYYEYHPITQRMIYRGDIKGVTK